MPALLACALGSPVDGGHANGRQRRKEGRRGDPPTMGH